VLIGNTLAYPVIKSTGYLNANNFFTECAAPMNPSAQYYCNLFLVNLGFIYYPNLETISPSGLPTTCDMNQQFSGVNQSGVAIFTDAGDYIDTFYYSAGRALIEGKSSVEGTMHKDVLSSKRFVSERKAKWERSQAITATGKGQTSSRGNIKLKATDSKRDAMRAISQEARSVYEQTGIVSTVEAISSTEQGKDSSSVNARLKGGLANSQRYRINGDYGADHLRTISTRPALALLRRHFSGTSSSVDPTRDGVNARDASPSSLTHAAGMVMQDASAPTGYFAVTECDTGLVVAYPIDYCLISYEAGTSTEVGSIDYTYNTTSGVLVNSTYASSDCTGTAGQFTEVSYVTSCPSTFTPGAVRGAYSSTLVFPLANSVNGMLTKFYSSSTCTDSVAIGYLFTPQGVCIASGGYDPAYTAYPFILTCANSLANIFMFDDITTACPAGGSFNAASYSLQSGSCAATAQTNPYYQNTASLYQGLGAYYQEFCYSPAVAEVTPSPADEYFIGEQCTTGVQTAFPLGFCSASPYAATAQQYVQTSAQTVVVEYFPGATNCTGVASFYNGGSDAILYTLSSTGCVASQTYSNEDILYSGPFLFSNVALPTARGELTTYYSSSAGCSTKALASITGYSFVPAGNCTYNTQLSQYPFVYTCHGAKGATTPATGLYTYFSTSPTNDPVSHYSSYFYYGSGGAHAYGDTCGSPSSPEYIVSQKQYQLAEGCSTQIVGATQVAQAQSVTLGLYHAVSCYAGEASPPSSAGTAQGYV
jgi:hypothetical protein